METSAVHATAVETVVFDAAMLDASTLDTVALEAAMLDAPRLETAALEPATLEPAVIEAMTIERSATRDKDSVVEENPSAVPVAVPGRPSPAEAGEETDTEPCSKIDPRVGKEDARNRAHPGYAGSGGPYTSHGSYAGT